jgi:hypothetical protein
MEHSTQIKSREWFRTYLLRMFFIYCCLNIIDWVDTILVLNKGGVEMNPIFNYLINLNILNRFIIIFFWKSFLCLGLFYISAWWYKHPVLFYKEEYQRVFKVIPIIAIAMYLITILFMWIQMVMFL